MNSIDKNDWINHFDKVLNEPNARARDNQFLEYVKTSLPKLENITVINETLNRDISESEVVATIKSLKTGKAVFTDNIGKKVSRFQVKHDTPRCARACYRSAALRL